MIDNISKKSKLIPVFFLVLLLAFAARVDNVKRGVDLLITPAIAAEPVISMEPQDAEQKEKTTSSRLASQPIADEVDDAEIYSNDVEDILIQFREQRDKLNAREKVLYDLQVQMFKAAEKKINDQIVELKAIERELKKLLSLYSETEEKQLKRIVKMYESMKSKSAGPRFEQLDLSVQMDIAMRMKEKNMASIMEAMSVEAANILTTELATRGDTPTMDELKKSVSGK